MRRLSCSSQATGSISRSWKKISTNTGEMSTPPMSGIARCTGFMNGFLKPVQRAIPLIGGVDISPVFVLIFFQLLLMLPVAWLEQESLRMVARALLYVLLPAPISVLFPPPHPRNSHFFPPLLPAPYPPL